MMMSRPSLSKIACVAVIAVKMPLCPAMGWTNLAFTGQFCELPDDVVFTIEYSIRSAMAAVYGLLDLKLKPPPVYQGQYDPHVLFRAFAALHNIGA
jgi:myosin-crossreactive antigen